MGFDITTDIGLGGALFAVLGVAALLIVGVFLAVTVRQARRSVRGEAEDSDLDA